LTFTNHQYYNCRIYLDDQTEFLVDANWLHNNNLDQWQNWQCNAGADRIYIDPVGDVYSGECKNDHLGHIDQGWDLQQSAQCRRKTCTGCADDLLVAKQNVV
jgi:hypothetical protein